MRFPFLQTYDLQINPAVNFIVQCTIYVGFSNAQTYGDVNMTLLLLVNGRFS